MHKFHNMSVPPKSEIIIEIKQLNKMIAFDPDKICELLKCDKQNMIDAINKYIENNKDYELKAPKTYMFALKSDYKELDYDYCLDLDLLLCVLSKTAGNIYIPNRHSLFNKDKFKETLYFSERELYDNNR